MSFSAAKIKPFIPLGVLIFLLVFYALNNIAWLKLDTVPPYNDSAHHLANYRVVLQSLEGSMSPQQQSYYKQGFLYAPAYYYISALAAWFFGGTDLIHVPVNLFFFAILLIAVYASGKKLFGTREGITACLLLSLYPYMYGSTRIFVIEGALCSMAALCVCFLLYSEELRKTRFAVAAAIVCLLGMLTKQSFLIYVAGPLVLTMGKAVARREASKKVILWVCVGVVLPLILSSNPGTIDLFRIHFVRDAALYSPGDPWARAFYYVLLLPDQINILSLLVFIAGLAGYLFIKPKDRAFVLIWLLTPLIILTLDPLKSSKYSLPLLPVIALISSWGLYAIVKKSVVRYAFLSVVLVFGVFVHCALLWDIPLPINPFTGKKLSMDLVPYLEYVHKPQNKHLDKVQAELFEVLREHAVPGRIHHVGITGFDRHLDGLITPAKFRFTDNFIVVNEWGMKSYILRHRLPLTIRVLKKIHDLYSPDEISTFDFLVTALPLAEFFPQMCFFYDLTVTLVVPSDGSKIYLYSKNRSRLDEAQDKIFKVLRDHAVPDKIHHVGITGVSSNGWITPAKFRFTDNFMVVNDRGMKSYVLRYQLPFVVHPLEEISDYYGPEGISKFDHLVTALPLAELYPQVCFLYDRVATLEVPSDGSKIYIYSKNRSRLNEVQNKIFKVLRDHVVPDRVNHVGIIGSKGLIDPAKFRFTDNFIIVNDWEMKSFILQHQLPLTVRTLTRSLELYAPEGISRLDLLIMGFPMEEFFPQVNRFYDGVATLEVPSDGSKIYIYSKDKERGRSEVFESQWVKEVSNNARIPKAQEAFKEGRYDDSIKLLREFLEGEEATGHLQAVAYVGLASNYVELMVRDAAVSKGYFSKADHYFNEALKVMDVSDPLSSSAYSGLGYLYLSKRSYEQALGYLNRGLSYYPREGSLKEHGDLCTNIGYCYLGMKDPAKAREYFTRAIAVFSDAGYETLKGALTGLELCAPGPDARKTDG